MGTPRAHLGLIALVTIVLIVSSMGLIHAVSPTGAAPASGTSAATTAPSPAASEKQTTPTPAGPSVPASYTASTPLPSPPTPASVAGVTGDAASPRGAQILSALAAKGVPTHDIYLPYFLNGPHPGLTNGHVNLSYTSSPAPYGIGDFGLKNVSGVITPYTTSTKSVEANFSTDYLSGYSPDISGPDEWGVQLNAVLNDVTVKGQTGDQFWTQNVFDYYPALDSIAFVSNIWNFSSSSGILNCNSFYEVGGNCIQGYYYYGYTPLISVTEPFSAQLYLNSTLIGGRDAVFFNYSVTSGAGTYSGELDYAIFNSLVPGGNPVSTPAPAYVANGLAYNPLGLPDDFEITLGGPGGGSNFDVFESDSTYMSLQFWNTTANGYTTVPSAYNVGGETGETSVGVNAAWSEFGTTGVFPSRCVECVSLSSGPSFQYGMWGVRGATPAGNIVPETDWAAQSSLVLILHPSNAFLFITEGDPWTGSWLTTNWSLFQWAPNFAPLQYNLTLPVGNYTELFLLADHTFELVLGLSIATDTGFHFTFGVSLGVDLTMGVWTPLWAFNNSGLQSISSGVDGNGHDILYNNQYATLGEIPLTADVGTADGAYFPWFGAFNDYGFPVFPGILLSGVTDVDVFSPPSFSVTAPPNPSYQNAIQYFGWSETNSLQMFFWGDDAINFESATVTGWFPAASDFGPSQSFANVVFWNTSDSLISDNTFSTGGMALFLYGGYDNIIDNNYFLTGAPPLSANPYFTAAADYGAIGLVDADWGDASYYGAGAYYTCDYCDAIYNNAFDTWVTATSLYYDPYTGLYPALYPGDFSQAWNVPYEAGVTNILGGHYLGGNYWWDYGYADNPYGSLPDQELNFLPEVEFGADPGYIGDEYTGVGGDYYPLVNVALYNITFEEHGLPTGVGWYVDVSIPPLYYQFQDYYAENETSAPGNLNFTETAGTWYYYPYSEDSNYAAIDGNVTIADHKVVVAVDFRTAFVLTVKETGLPSGTYWYAETYAPAVGYNSLSSHGTETNVSGLLAGTYTWWAYPEYSAYYQYRSVPYEATVTISANTTATVAFVAIYSLDVHSLGLPTGARWAFDASSAAGYNYTYTSGGGWINITTASATYSWTAGSAGYVAAPGSGTLALSANTTLTVTFLAAAIVTFTETGLPSGTSWTVAVTQGTNTTTLGGNGSSIAVPAVAGAYKYTVSASVYASTPSSGSGTLPANSAVSVAFALSTGTLSGAVTPSGATLSVDGTQQTLGTGGAYSLTLPVGVHSVEVTAAGYVTYFNNASVSLAKTTTLNITLTSIMTSSGSSGISTTAWILIGVLAALAVVFLVTTLIFARRGGKRPPATPYMPPAGAAPAGATQPWQEPPPPPPGSS